MYLLPNHVYLNLCEYNKKEIMDVKLIVMCCIIIKTTFGLELDFEDSSENSTAMYNTTFRNVESDVSSLTLYKIGEYCSLNVCAYLLQISTYFFGGSLESP